MSRRLTFRPKAESDLRARRWFISQDSPTNAAAFTARIRARCLALTVFPEQGTLRDDLGPGLRIVGFERRVTIVFRVLPDRVQIVRVLYGGRDAERLLRSEP